MYCITIIVRPGHVKFTLELKEILENTLCRRQESILMVDDLVHLLQNKFPEETTRLGRSNVLTAVSKLYGKNVEYMGKKKT